MATHGAVRAELTLCGWAKAWKCHSSTHSEASITPQVYKELLTPPPDPTWRVCVNWLWISVTLEITNPRSPARQSHASSEALTMLSAPEELKDGWGALMAELGPENEQRFSEQHLKWHKLCYKIDHFLTHGRTLPGHSTSYSIKPW